MATTLTKILVHVTFSTKNREPVLSAMHDEELAAYVGGICRRLSSPVLAMNGTPDHVHMLVSLGKTISIADLMLEVKRDSSKWMHARGMPLDWQDGYFAFSIGESGVPALRRYIAGQKEHHRRVSFQEELRAILGKYGVEFDERYVWK